MSKLTNVSKEEKKMLRKTFWRAFTLFTAVTPAKQGASGFCYSMMPFIDHFIKCGREESGAGSPYGLLQHNDTDVDLYYGHRRFNGKREQQE